jgi:hypothetical protein
MSEMCQVLICCVAVFSGGILQGCLGFGFAFIALPVFALFIAPAIATPLIVMLSLILNFIVIFSCKEYANKKIIGYLLIGGIVGTPMGTHLLKHVDPFSYTLAVGILIMIAAGLFLADKRCRLKETMINSFPAGFVSGVLNASIGLSGPPVVLFMTTQSFNKHVMRATLIGYFLIINMITLFWFVNQRLISSDVIGYMRFFVPVLIAGTLSGVFITRFIDEQRFRKIILVVVMLIGFAVSMKSFL